MSERNLLCTDKKIRKYKNYEALCQANKHFAVKSNDLRKIRKPLEKEIQAAILGYLHAKGIFCWRQNTTGTWRPDRGRFVPNAGMLGVPDIIGCLPNGQFFGVEVKRPGGKPTLDQIRFHDTVNRLGGLCFVATSVEDVKARF